MAHKTKEIEGCSESNIPNGFCVFQFSDEGEKRENHLHFYIASDSVAKIKKSAGIDLK